MLPPNCFCILMCFDLLGLDHGHYSVVTKQVVVLFVFFKIMLVSPFFFVLLAMSAFKLVCGNVKEVNYNHLFYLLQRIIVFT